MKIILIHKAELAVRPPVISSLLILSDLGHQVTLIDEKITDYWKEELKKRKISYYEIKRDYKSSSFSKLLSYYKFRKRTCRILKEIGNEAMIWVEGAQTVVALGNIINDFRHVLQIQELHEKSKRQIKAIDNVIHQAEAVFMPEYNRTMIYKVWFKLNKRPYLLPNKPYFVLSETSCNRVLNEYHDQICNLKDKKVILYQGGIKRIRMLDKIASAISDIDNNYHLLVVGPEQEPGVIGELKEITSEITHISFIPAPDYMAFCKIAHIGYVTYEPNSLNNIFCAPNKIFEYSSFGLPMIANDIPGLRFTVGVSGACELVEPTNINSIVEGLQRIENSYSKYKENSITFYNSVDNRKTIHDVLSCVK